MNSFNSYGQTTKKFGGNTPVWLGTVKPIPVGAVLDAYGEEIQFPFFIAAGTPVVYRVNEDITLFLPWDPEGGDTPNGYLYNDVFVEAHDAKEGYFATGAIVKYHAEGLLIDRTGFGAYAAELQAAIPGVLLVKESELPA